MSEEWGPWIEHDGSGCPCVGLPCEIEAYYTGKDPSPGSIALGGASWSWRIYIGHPCCYDIGVNPIVRYRIRKPRGVTILEEIAQGVKQPEDA